jgi:hypothetical protein
MPKSFRNTFLMKDYVNDEVPNGTPKTLIPFNGVLNYNGVTKSSGKPHGDHATHL